MSFNLKRARWVRKMADGNYTMEPESSLKSSTLICDSCGIKNACPVKSTMERAKGFADLYVRTCHKYVPLLTFKQSLIGCNSVFNTFRVGKVWYELLHQGRDLVALLDEAEEIIGFYNVKSVHLGQFDEMIRKHARFNHLLKDEYEGTAMEYVAHELRKSYGQFLNEESMLTAIYLEQMEDQSALLKSAMKG
jgi:hypothetical protein